MRAMTLHTASVSRTHTIASTLATTLAKPGLWLWVVQGLLAAVFLLAGGSKMVLPLEMMKGPVALPLLFLRFLGTCEVLGAFGLILPGLLMIRPGLTPLAAAGLVIIMTGATVLTAAFMSVGMAMMPLVIGLLAAFVAYGRVRLAPQRRSSRSRLAVA